MFTSGDITGLVLSYIYAFGLLFSVEAIGKWLSWPHFLTRKFIHIGAGMWIWGILYFFDHWYFGIIPFATFIVLNYIFYRYQIFKAMDDADATPGTIYFAISITVLFTLLWRTGGRTDHVPTAAAAVMAMTWGDAAASIVGKTWGKHDYTTFGHKRSREGSITMAIVAFIAMLATLLYLPASNLSPNSVPLSFPQAVVVALVGSLIAALAESQSPAGTDNLSVPLLTGLVLYIMQIII